MISSGHHSWNGYGEDYYTFVNGQHTIQVSSHHLIPWGIRKNRQGILQKRFRSYDIRTSIIAAISIKVEDPVFESQTKTKLGSKDMGPNGPSVKQFITDFIKEKLDNYLHRNSETAQILLQKIVESEKERKAISSIKKIARERAKKASLHNRKLRDCRIHYNSNEQRALESTLFITEGDSASGSITKSRDVNTHAVFSLRGNTP